MKLLFRAWLVCLAITTVFVTSSLAKPRQRPKPLNAVKLCKTVQDPFYQPPAFMLVLGSTINAQADFMCTDGNQSGCGLHTRFTINDVLISDQVVPGVCNFGVHASDWVDMANFPKGDWLCRYQIWDINNVKLYPDQFILWSVR